jgi:hypothetical protein
LRKGDVMAEQEAEEIMVPDETYTECIEAIVSPNHRRKNSRQLALEWAQSLDSCPVVFQMPGDHPLVIGIAAAGAWLGGWPALRIYVGIAGDGHRLPLRGPAATWLELGELNGRAVWYFDVQWSNRNRVSTLENWPTSDDTLIMYGLLSSTATNDSDKSVRLPLETGLHNREQAATI